MSHTTESVHVRGVRLSRVVAAVESFLGVNGFVRVPDDKRAHAERIEPSLERITLRRDGAWITLADNRENTLEGWGRHLSGVLARSVLTIHTWDGEQTVAVVRWKDGNRKKALSLLSQAFRGPDGRPRAPSRVLWPWLAKERRDTILREGVLLVEPMTRTGDDDLDELLEGFDEADGELTGEIYVPLETTVEALGHAIGLSRPFLNPWSPEEGDLELVFRPSRN
jgi:hypothetical protein